MLIGIIFKDLVCILSVFGTVYEIFTSQKIIKRYVIIVFPLHNPPLSSRDPTRYLLPEQF